MGPRSVFLPCSPCFLTDGPDIWQTTGIQRRGKDPTIATSGVTCPPFTARPTPRIIDVCTVR